MSEVVPLPSFGEVFFDARGQERCLRVTWHEGTLVLSLWRGEMCTASFRMPLDDVDRLIDTLDEGYAEATGETQSGEADAAPDPGTEAIPGTGTYHRPAQRPPHEERPAAPLGPNDVLVARGNPGHQDKLVASHGENTPPRGTATPQYGGQHYADQANEPFTGPQYAPDGGYRDPYSGPQYVQQDQQPFSGPQYADEQAEPVYQMPGGQPPHTDPLGFPAEPSYEQRGDSYGGGQYQQQPRTVPSSGPGVGTPMHGIPGAGRRQDPFQNQDPGYGQDYNQDQGYRQDPSYTQDPGYRRDHSYGQDPGYGVDPSYGQDPGYGQNTGYGQDHYNGAPNPADPLMSMGHQEPDRSRPYLDEPLFSTGERLRPDQEEQHDRREW